MTMTTTTQTLRYEIEAGEVRLYAGEKLIASKPAAKVLRSFSLTKSTFFSQHLSTLSMLKHFGLKVHRLPTGLTVRDIMVAYSIARDEMLDAA